MTELPGDPEQRSLAVRILLMILLTLAFHLAVTLLAVTALVQLVLALVSSGPNQRLQRFGRALGRYLHQLSDFLTFASETAPFPFSDWPSVHADDSQGSA